MCSCGYSFLLGSYVSINKINVHVIGSVYVVMEILELVDNISLSHLVLLLEKVSGFYVVMNLDLESGKEFLENNKEYRFEYIQTYLCTTCFFSFLKDLKSTSLPITSFLFTICFLYLQNHYIVVSC